MTLDHDVVTAFLLFGWALAALCLLRIWRLRREAAQRDKALRLVSETAARHRFLIDQAADVIWQFDRDLAITDVSDAVRALTRHTPFQLRGCKIGSLITERSFAEFQEAVRALGTRDHPAFQRPFKVELEFLTETEPSLWAEMHVAELRGAREEIAGYCGITRDISDRKHAEAALRLSEGKFRNLLGIAPFAIALFRQEDGCVLYANERAAQQFGLSVDVLIGSSARDFLDNPKLAEQIDHPPAGTGYAADMQIRFRRADGEAFWALYSCRRAIFEGIEVVFLAFSDITATKQIETDLIDANRLLQQRLEEIGLLQAQLREQAVRDGLTGLFNRRYLDETLERELARARREGSPLALVMIDVDHFKRVNDTYGHQAGDEVLKTLARLVAQSTRIEDIVCRFGGEEFLVMLPKANAEFAFARAEQWRQNFEAMAIQAGDAIIHSTISLGVVAYPEIDAEASRLLRLSDEALYRAKKAGRNRAVICEEDCLRARTGSD